MFFSIATPTRDAMPALRRCVGSVRRQTAADCEHLIRDAVSRDGTVEWLRDQTDLQWTSRPDAGMYDAINAAWSDAGGDILSWLNADEQYLPGTLETVKAAFQSDPDVDIVWGNVVVIDPAGKLVAWRREIPLRLPYVRYVTLYAFSCAMFFRRRLWDDGLLRFDSSFQVIADADLVARLLEHGVRTRHLATTLSLFELSQSNLSIRERARKEDERRRFRDRHKVRCHRCVRPAVRLLRCTEKLLAGCYRRTPVRYSYTLDEAGAAREFLNARAAARFKLTAAGNGETNHA